MSQREEEVLYPSWPRLLSDSFLFVQISMLESRVQAYFTRSSLLQTRLLSSLNAFDVAQNAYQRKIESLSQERDKFKLKSKQHLEALKLAQLDRDDMRDVVLRLIEKGGCGAASTVSYMFSFALVETSNDYSKWSHSQFVVSSLAGTFS